MYRAGSPHVVLATKKKKKKKTAESLGNTRLHILSQVYFADQQITDGKFHVLKWNSEASIQFPPTYADQIVRNKNITVPCNIQLLLMCIPSHEEIFFSLLSIFSHHVLCLPTKNNLENSHERQLLPRHHAMI